MENLIIKVVDKYITWGWSDIESKKIQVAGFIVREESLTPSNFRSTESLGQYLRKNNTIGIQEIDTRMLTRIIRNEGAMNGIISTEDIDESSLINKVKSFPSMNGMDLAKIVSTKKYIHGKILKIINIKLQQLILVLNIIFCAFFKTIIAILLYSQHLCPLKKY